MRDNGIHPAVRIGHVAPTRLTSSLALALAAATLCSVGAGTAFADHGQLPDAEIFASNTTAVITDPGDPRLDARLVRFKREVNRIIRRGGGQPRESQLLDGVFFSTILGFTTFERSREFDVDGVSQRELRVIANRVRRRYHQQSVLTFDYPERRSDSIDAVEVEVPGLRAQQLRDGFQADAEARQRLAGGSVTVDGRLILIAALEDFQLVERFVSEIGGDFDDATIRGGQQEFVD
jgi:hypothetical protein